MLFQVLEERRLGAATWALAEELSRAKEPAGPFLGLERGTVKEPRAHPSRPVPSAPLLSPLTVAKCFLQGVPVWLTLGAVLCDLCFGRSPSRSPSPLPPCRSQQGRGSPAWRALISHPPSVNPNLFGVPYSAPLSPVPPSASSPAQPQPQPARFPPPPPAVYSVDHGFERTL